MLKKIDRGALFLAKQQALFRCPKCHREMNQIEKSLICSNGHRFDLAKKGTLYFLDHQIKTEYDNEMFAPRGRMIRSGMYQPVIEKLAQLIKPGNLLDVGCGEGSFLQEINQTNLPIADQSFDTILNIFSPSHYSEFKRVMKPDGCVVKVIPQAGYLKELRAVYHPNGEEYSNEAVIQRFTEELKIDHRERVTYEFEIPQENRLDLLEMSPLEWQVSPEIKAQLAENPLKRITIDIEILKGY